MGLDMYLYGSRYLFKRNGRNANDQYDLDEMRKLASISVLVESGLDPQIKELVVEVAYWRKAHEIHGWFVKNVQSDVDDCGSYYVSIPQLARLKEDCQQVLLIPSMAEVLFPSDSPYFGAPKFDEWFLAQLKYTIDKVDECLKYPQEWDFKYRASW